MRELFQCILCASFGFITASLLAAGKNHSSTEVNIDTPTQSDLVSEVTTANNLVIVTKNS